ncbi:hypothetical protein HanPSC8_Chr17g0778861 [Helianthus annuus]|nr:hypothetical protein HanPSC8_Chr17g0778861 [Helianthus annuus]
MVPYRNNQKHHKSSRYQIGTENVSSLVNLVPVPVRNQYPVPCVIPNLNAYYTC